MRDQLRRRNQSPAGSSLREARAADGRIGGLDEARRSGLGSPGTTWAAKSWGSSNGIKMRNVEPVRGRQPARECAAMRRCLTRETAKSMEWFPSILACPEPRRENVCDLAYCMPVNPRSRVRSHVAGKHRGPERALAGWADPMSDQAPDGGKASGILGAGENGSPFNHCTVSDFVLRRCTARQRGGDHGSACLHIATFVWVPISL